MWHTHSLKCVIFMHLRALLSEFTTQKKRNGLKQLIAGGKLATYKPSKGSESWIQHSSFSSVKTWSECKWCISIANWEASGVRIQNITMQPYISCHLCHYTLTHLFPQKYFTCISSFLVSYLVFAVSSLYSVSFQEILNIYIYIQWAENGRRRLKTFIFYTQMCLLKALSGYRLGTYKNLPSHWLIPKTQGTLWQMLTNYFR